MLRAIERHKGRVIGLRDRSAHAVKPGSPAIAAQS